MIQSDEKSEDVIVGTVGSAISSVAQAAATAYGLSPEASVGLSVFAGSIPALIRRGFQMRAERRCSLAALGMEDAARHQGRSPAAAPETLNAQEAFVSMFHDLMDSVDESAARPLGHIAMTYAQLDLRPDAFFRAFGRVIRELGAVELDDLRRLLDQCVQCIDDGRSAAADNAVVRTAFQDPIGHKLELRCSTPKEGWTSILEVSGGVRLLLLMKQHGLASEPVDLPGIMGGEPVQARIWRGFAGRALTHLTPEPETGTTTGGG